MAPDVETKRPFPGQNLDKRLNVYSPSTAQDFPSQQKYPNQLHQISLANHSESLDTVLLGLRGQFTVFLHNGVFVFEFLSLVASAECELSFTFTFAFCLAGRATRTFTNWRFDPKMKILVMTTKIRTDIKFLVTCVDIILIINHFSLARP